MNDGVSGATLNSAVEGDTTVGLLLLTDIVVQPLPIPPTYQDLPNQLPPTSESFYLY